MNNCTGGGAVAVHYSTIVIDNCKFAENNAHIGGAIRMLQTDTTITNSLFYKNYCFLDSTTEISQGGAIHINDGNYDKKRRLLIDNTRFEENSSPGRGGAMLSNIYLVYKPYIILLTIYIVIIVDHLHQAALIPI